MDDALSSFRALQAIASLVNQGSDVEATLAHLLEAFCRGSRWAGAVIMSVDDREGVVRVVARHDPGGLASGPERAWSLAESPTRRVLASGEPLVIRDAQTAAAFPGYRQEALARGYRTVVLIPMAGEGGEPGNVLAACAREIVDVSERDIAFLQLVVHLGAIAIRKARSLSHETAFAARLRTVLSGHATLLERALAGGSVPDVAALLAEMLPDPLAIVDLTSRRVVVDRSPDPRVLDDAAWQRAADGEARAQLLNVALRSGTGPAIGSRDITLQIDGRVLQRAASICPLRVDGSLVGALIVFSSDSGRADLDHLVIDSARFGLSVQLMRAHVRFTTEARGLEDIVSGLLHATMSSAEIRERAARLDLALDGPGRLLVIGPADPAALDGPAALEALRAISDLARTVDPRARAVIIARSIIILCSGQPSETKARMLVRQALHEIDRATGEGGIAVRSRLCAGLADYPAAFQECGRVLDLARRFGRTGELTAQDFGAFPVLMSAVDTAEIRTFVQGLIGEVARHDAARGTAYLATLSAYLDHGGRSQACAATLGLHVTTLRYRLSRLRELFGLTFETPDQRFALQLALRFQDVIAPAAASAPPPKRRRRTPVPSSAS